MTKTLIDGNTIQRIVCIEFDINASISYEEFCKNPIYMSLFTDIKDKDYIASPNMLNTGSRGYSGWLNLSVQRKIDLLTSYDLIEKFENGMSYERREEKIFPQKEWFFDSLFNFQIDEMKHYFTDNHLILDKEARKKRYDYQAILLYPELMNKIKYAGDYDNYLQTGRTTRKNIKFRQTIVEHKRMEYTIFMALISDEPFYLLTDEHFLNISIVSESNLSKHITYFSTVKNISGFKEYIKQQDTIDAINNLKIKYGESENKMEKVIKDLLDMIKKTKTLKISLDIQDSKPMYMKGQFKSNDYDKYGALQAYTADYGYVAYKNHKGNKKSIVGEKEFKYKDDNRKKLK